MPPVPPWAVIRLQRLRDIINKGLTNEELLRGVKTAWDKGWRQIKLYFMIVSTAATMPPLVYFHPGRKIVTPPCILFLQEHQKPALPMLTWFLMRPGVRL